MFELLRHSTSSAQMMTATAARQLRRQHIRALPRSFRPPSSDLFPAFGDEGASEGDFAVLATNVQDRLGEGLAQSLDVFTAVTSEAVAESAR